MSRYYPVGGGSSAPTQPWELWTHSAIGAILLPDASVTTSMDETGYTDPVYQDDASGHGVDAVGWFWFQDTTAVDDNIASINEDSSTQNTEPRQLPWMAYACAISRVTDVQWGLAYGSQGAAESIAAADDAAGEMYIGFSFDPFGRSHTTIQLVHDDSGASHTIVDTLIPGSKLLTGLAFVIRWTSATAATVLVYDMTDGAELFSAAITTNLPTGTDSIRGESTAIIPVNSGGLATIYHYRLVTGFGVQAN